jgi:glycosyltransferase involved in cell wall biosynthesis
MTAPPRISVIVPCHDDGAFLDEGLDSVLAQTFGDFEILVVDDASTDPDTRARLAGLDRPRTRLFTGPGRGPAAARNVAVRAARGELLCALDADDRLEPELFAKCVAELERDPSLTFVSFWLRAFGAEDWEWRQHRCDLPALLAECTVGTAALVRARAVVDAGGYDEAPELVGNEDWDLWLRLVARGGRGVILPEVLFHYRRRPGSLSTKTTQGEAHLRFTRHFVEKHRALYQEHLHDVLVWRERDLAELLAANYALERRIASLDDDAARRRRELERLERRLAAVRAARAAAGYGAKLERELDAMRGSVSWRLTGPARSAVDLWRRLRRSGP